MKVSIKQNGGNGADLTSLPFELDELVAAIKAGRPFEIKAMCDDQHRARIGISHNDLYPYHDHHVGTIKIYLGGWGVPKQ